MKQFIVAGWLVLSLMACTSPTSDEHAHNPDGSHAGETALNPVSYTIYSDTSELFVEFKPLVVGATSGFATHLTRLGEIFTPYLEGSVTVSLIVANNGIRNSVSGPGSPGIFRLALRPTQAGWGKLVFDIVTKDFSDQIVIDSIRVYEDEQSAIADQPKDAGETEITYLKEQAWKVEFANAPVARGSMYDVIKTTGEVLSAPGDEVTIAARSNGIVRFTGQNNVIGSQVRSGQRMFSITGGEIAFENVEAAKAAARAELDIARSEYDRALELIKDKLITQSEFEAAKLRFQNSQIALNNLSRNYSAGGKTLTSPINGFVKSIMVSEGQYVTAGQPLATVMKNQRLILRADVSLKESEKVSLVTEANFKLSQTNTTYNTRAMNARLVAAGRSTANNSPFIPVHFELDRHPEIIPGSFAEIYLKTTPLSNVLIIPVSALIEEQGIYYVYVQTGGESFQKREVKPGVNDGQQVQVLSGLIEGERVVTKGAYQIKLSTASGSLPAHGHEH